MDAKKAVAATLASVMLATPLSGCTEAWKVRHNLYELNIIPEMIGGVKVTSKK